MSGTHPKPRLNASERRAALVAQEVISEEEAETLSVADEQAIGRPIENPIGVMAIPVGMAEHFVVNDRSIAGIPMATEEASIVAAASKAAKLAKSLGGFTARSAPFAVARGHILYGGFDEEEAQGTWSTLHGALESLTGNLRMQDPLLKRGGGLLRVSVEQSISSRRSFVIVKLSVNPAEAMGANAVTRLGHWLADHVKAKTGLTACGVICSNHQSGWSVGAHGSWPIALIGKDRGQRVLDWQAFAGQNIYRAVTHNKGIMNGITAVALATGQDTRAIEACVHASALVSGAYLPLTSYSVDAASQTIRGELRVTLPVATKGGRTDHPQAVVYRKIMGAKTSRELACIMAAVGLAQNFGALYCLAGEGIPAAHVALANAR